jgi:hypothetical protein
MRVVLGGGKRLFDDLEETVSLEHVGLLQSPFATHISYRVVRLAGPPSSSTAHESLLTKRRMRPSRGNRPGR